MNYYCDIPAVDMQPFGVEDCVSGNGFGFYIIVSRPADQQTLGFSLGIEEG